jgi:hypothetical protein
MNGFTLVKYGVNLNETIKFYNFDQCRKNFLSNQFSHCLYPEMYGTLCIFDGSIADAWLNIPGEYNVFTCAKESIKN